MGNNDMNSVYLTQEVAKRMVEEVLYGKPQPKKQSRVKTMLKNLVK